MIKSFATPIIAINANTKVIHNDRMVFWNDRYTYLHDLHLYFDNTLERPTYTRTSK